LKKKEMYSKIEKLIGANEIIVFIKGTPDDP
jgi:glutaredoxin-related protein